MWGAEKEEGREKGVIVKGRSRGKRDAGDTVREQGEMGDRGKEDEK